MRDTAAPRADEEYVESVLSLVEQVPPGRVTTYGALADVVGSGPRLVGHVLARHGAAVPWWRVVRADGSLPPSHHDDARAHYLDEGTALRRSGVAVDLAAAFWQPPAPVDLLAAYDGALRGAGEVAGATWHDTTGPLWRAVFGEHALVSYEDLAGHDLAALVEETVAFFTARTDVTSVEWKTRGHDDLPELHDVLLRAGFEPEDPETVMVGECAALAVDVELPDGIVVRRVDDAPDRERLLGAASALQREVFGRSSGGESLLERVERSDGALEVWVAEGPDGLVSTGRLELVAGTGFGGLWGGATLPGWRGRGIYRALTAARARSAARRGARWLHSDCSEMSRPILERSGLVAVTTTTPYTWSRPAPVRPTHR